MKKIEMDLSEDLPMEALFLQCREDKYKLAYAAIRWAKEIKQKENLPEVIQALVPRSLREILQGKVTLKEIEKLPMAVKVAPPPPPPQPTITLNVAPEETAEPELTEKE